MTSIQAKIPLIPRGISTSVHRTFIDGFDSPAGKGGVYIVEWTPPPEEISEDRYCGIRVPLPPSRSSAVQVQLATTHVHPQAGEENRCAVIMAGNNDFKVNRRLIPDVVLRKFLAMNSRVLAGKISACLEDMAGCGYRQRISTDAQGFYRLVERRAAQSSAGV